MVDNLGLKMTSYKKLYVMGDDLVLCLYNDPNFSSSIVTKQAEAEVVPSSSLVEVEVKVEARG